MPFAANTKTTFQTALLRWYHKHKRDLPWRQTKDPYKIWISEVMLQQTQVASVIDYYHRFLKRFPDILSLANAKEEEVLTLWSGLGYYSRAKNLQKAAGQIVEKHQNQFPKDPKAILDLPGIGRYTLGAIASIAFDLPLPLVDGNVIRVYSRVFAIKGSPSDLKFQKQIWKIAEEMLPTSPSPPPCKGGGWGRSGDFNQALMELGATICTPKNPTCVSCPIQKLCRARLKNPEDFPEKKKRNPVQKLTRVALVIRKGEEILLTRSQENRWMKKMWQLPSVFLREKEKTEEGLSTLLKSWKLNFQKTTPLPSHSHTITHHKIKVLPYRVEVSKFHQDSNFRWISTQNIKNIPIPSADKKILAKVNA